jgi:hypothetical protein
MGDDDQGLRLLAHGLVQQITKRNLNLWTTNINALFVLLASAMPYINIIIYFINVYKILILGVD